MRTSTCRGCGADEGAEKGATMAVDDATKLLPCPFCGNPDVLLRDTEYDRTLWIIECSRCHMEVAAKHRDLIRGRRSTHDDLVAGWNKRAVTWRC